MAETTDNRPSDTGMKLLAPIRAELTADDTASAEGITAKTNAGPALALCRKLIDAGFDPQRPFHCYRGDTLCLTVTSIGWGAKYTIADGTNGRPGLRRYIVAGTLERVSCGLGKDR
jgi:hypothetical protein